MKIRVKVNDKDFLLDSIYDDETKTHQIKLLDGSIETACDLCSPINEEKEINGRTYIVQIDKHTKRKIGAFVETAPFDYRRFKSDKDYEDLLNGK